MKNLFIFSVCALFSLTLFNVAHAAIKPFGAKIIQIEQVHPEGKYLCINPELTIINVRGITPGVPTVLITNSQTKRYQNKTLRQGQWVLGFFDTNTESATCTLTPPGGTPTPYPASPIKSYGNSLI